jgi:hypothetical protein
MFCVCVASCANVGLYMLVCKTAEWTHDQSE